VEGALDESVREFGLWGRIHDRKLDSSRVVTLGDNATRRKAIYLRANLKEGTLPAAFGDTLDLSGKLMVDGGKVQLALDGASAGNVGVPTAVLAMIGDQINAALGTMAVPPVTLTTDSGSVSVALGGGM
jgi:hypothetical protein